MTLTLTISMTLICRSRGCEDIWNHVLGARESPTGKDVSQRGHCWDPLPGNDGRRHRRLNVCCSTVICRVCRSVKLLQLTVVTRYKRVVIPITRPNSVSGPKYVKICLCIYTHEVSVHCSQHRKKNRTCIWTLGSTCTATRRSTQGTEHPAFRSVHHFTGDKIYTRHLAIAG
jgi:hypothetical protein